ncbi:hypothetical protein ABT187_49730, partial [Streptomyces sp. NPDC001817]
MSSLAKAFAESAAGVVDQLSNAVAVTSAVDFTNTSFLQTYSIVFGASVFLVMFIWLWAVIKRAVQVLQGSFESLLSASLVVDLSGEGLVGSAPQGLG